MSHQRLNDGADGSGGGGGGDNNNFLFGDEGDDDAAARSMAAELELAAMERRRRRRQLCTLTVVVVVGAVAVAFLIMTMYSTDRASRLWTHYTSSRTKRRYCLFNADSGPSFAAAVPMSGAGAGAAVSSVYAVGALSMDARSAVVDLNLVLFGVFNATSVHVYGPLEPSSPNAPQAIALNSDLAGDYVSSATGAGRLRVRVRALDADDVDRVYADPALYYVGLSTISHPHGAAARFPIGIECNP